MMIDEEKVKRAVTLFLEGIGEDTSREGLIETPVRIVRMVKEVFGGLEEDASIHFDKTFLVEHNEMVLEKGIRFYSTCEHHLLPFFGYVHIAYIPSGRVAGLSKLARVVEVYARRPQIQEQLGIQIADAFMNYLKPKGVMVMIEAEHMCMSMRGIKKQGVTTSTYVTRGVFSDHLELQNNFFSLVKS